MKKVIVITSLITASALSINSAQAGSKNENVGFASGALTGAAVAGPVGMIVGGTLGAIFGDQVEKATQLEAVEIELAQAHATQQRLISEIEQKNAQTANDLQVAKVEWLSEGLALNLMFTTNSSQLSDMDTENLQRVATILNQFPQLTLRLDGYSDPRGSKSDNLLLSQKRVDAVVSAFKTLGIEEQRMQGFAYGESSGVQIDQGVDAYAMARKVRVNFVSENTGQLAQN